jgi:hypothetical protein
MIRQSADSLERQVLQRLGTGRNGIRSRDSSRIIDARPGGAQSNSFEQLLQQAILNASNMNAQRTNQSLPQGIGLDAILQRLAQR